MRTLIGGSAAALILLGVAPGASADNDKVRNATERARDRQEIRKNQQEQADDLADRTEAVKLAEALAAARETNDEAALAAVDASVLHYLAGEVKEAGQEEGQAKREVRQGRREVRSDRREIRENRKKNEKVVRKIDDRRDRRDDRRDLRDDQSDAREEAGRFERLTRIHEDWNALEGNFEPGALDRRAELLVALQALATSEVAENVEESAEDRRELREDRRETREDRRQGD
ncbi:MAG: hypothetical protein DHS20C21_10870 [Gemmatimonadota bacterium]|nr:MAG: hypothetical protein DHS20C21_10870 [Gemmatimonadota bacterium]